MTYISLALRGEFQEYVWWIMVLTPRPVLQDIGSCYRYYILETFRCTYSLDLLHGGLLCPSNRAGPIGPYIWDSDGGCTRSIWKGGTRGVESAILKYWIIRLGDTSTSLRKMAEGLAEWLENNCLPWEDCCYLMRGGRGGGFIGLEKHLGLSWCWSGTFKLHIEEHNESESWLFGLYVSYSFFNKQD